jgi:ankyrin repeat protein/endonuclease/exonuclease/phosphatase family metal-dependent hydrolase
MIRTVSEIKKLKKAIKEKNITRTSPKNGEIVLSIRNKSVLYTGLKQIGKGYNADVYCCTWDNNVLKIGDPVSLGIEYLIYEDLKKIYFPVINMEITEEYALIKPYLDPNFFANKIGDFSKLQKEKLQQLWKQANEYAIITGIPLDLKADNLWWDEKNKSWVLVDAGPKLDDDDYHKFEFTLDLKSGKDFIRKIRGEKVDALNIKYQETDKISLIIDYGLIPQLFLVPIETGVINYGNERKRLYDTTIKIIKAAINDPRPSLIFQAIFYLKCVPLSDEIIELVRSNVKMSEELCKTYSICPINEQEEQNIEKSFKKEVKNILQLRKDTEKYHSSLSVEDKKVIKDYTGSSYDAMNNCLRNGTDSLKCGDDVVNKIIRLDKILTDKNSPRLVENIVVYRGINDFKNQESQRVALALESLQPGDLWEDRGFVSTSVQHPPEDFVGLKCCLFEIFLKKGTPAYYIGKDSSVSHEEEIILLPGIVLKFIGKRTGDKAILFRGKRYVNTYSFECAGCQENTRFAISPIPKEIDTGLKREVLPFQPLDRLVGKDRLSYFHLTDMYNKYIPKKKNDFFRLLSWNIHEWRDKNSKVNRDEFIKVFQSLNPDVLALQEVTLQSYGSGCEADMGSHGEKLRNDIVVRKSIEKFLEIPISIKHERCMMIVGIILNGQKIIIGNLHLDVRSSNKRIDNITTALESIEKIARDNGTENIILMGDFNSYRIGDYNEQNYRELVKLKSGLTDGMNIFETIEILEKRGYVDSFSVRKVSPPINTNYYGGRIDFIFLSRNLSDKLVGTYAYYSNLSDHIAIIADFSFSSLGDEPIIQNKIQDKSEADEMLFASSVKGDLNGIKEALKRGANIHAKNEYALTWSIIKGDKEILKYLIEKGANIQDNKDEFIKMAEKYAHAEITEYLKQIGKNPKQTGKYQLDEMLIESAINGDLKGVKEALKRGANIHASSDWALINAVKKGHLQVVKYLVENGANIHALNESPLLFAITFEKLEIVKYLVEKGANIHNNNDEPIKLADNKGNKEIVAYLKSQIGDKIRNVSKQKGGVIPNMILFKTASEGDLKGVKEALRKGADIHADNEWALLSAIKNGQLDIVKYLVENGANIHINKDQPIKLAEKGRNKEIAAYLKSQIIFNELLDNSSFRGDLSGVKEALKRGANIHDQNESALISAINGGNLEVVKYLVERGANIHSGGGLQSASLKGNLEIVKYLVEKGVSINDINSALKYASNLEVFKYLVEKGADIHFNNDEALKVAEKIGEKEIVNFIKSKTRPNKNQDIEKYNKLLLDSSKLGNLYGVMEALKMGADIHTKNDDALMSAITKGDLEIVKYLIKEGANINVNNGESMRIASARGHLDIVKYLVETGKFNNALNGALIYASERGHLEVVKYLVGKGADIHFKNDVPLRLASHNGYLEVVKYLVEKGANIHAENDIALNWAKAAGQSEVLNYLENL